MADRLAAWPRFAAWLGMTFRRGPVDATGKRLRPATVRSYGEYTALQFIRGQTQSRMRTGDPDFLLIDYTRTMLGCLLWRPSPACIGMVGLGGGSQVKFCRRHFPRSRIEVVENNVQVIALRDTFRIPQDDDQLQVSLDDGARFMARVAGRYDILLVDGYDEAGIPDALSSQAFYDDCRASLASHGVMAVNLYCADSGLHLERLRRSFGQTRVLVLEEARMSNRVAFAWIGQPPEHSDAALESILAEIPKPAGDQLAPVFAGVAAGLRSRRSQEV
jgi:spermidine synthase